MTGLSSLSVKGTAAAYNLISVALCLNFLGAERFGLWMVVTSIVSLLAFADLGLGNGLVSGIAEADGRNDREAVRRCVSNAWALLCLSAVLLLLAFALVYPFVDWGKVFNVHSGLAQREAGPVMAVLTVNLALSLVLGVVQKVQLGFQEGLKCNLWQAAGTVLSLIGLLLALRLGVGLVGLIVWTATGPLLALAVCSIYEFYVLRPWARPSLGLFHWLTARKYARTGGYFFILSLMTVLGTTADNLVLAHVLGPGSVSLYSVVFKLFSMTLITQLFIAPLWPAFGEAVARADYAWVQKTFWRATRWGTILSAGFAILFFLCGKWFIEYWTKGVVSPPTSLMAAFAAWIFIASIGGVLSALLNNPAWLGTQVIIISSASLISVALKVPFALWFDEAGVVWATIVAYTLVFVLPATFFAHRIFQRWELESGTSVPSESGAETR